MSSRVDEYTYKGEKPVKLVKWKVRVGSRVSHGTVLLLFQDEEQENRERSIPKTHRKLKCDIEGTVQKLVAGEGTTILPGMVLLYLESSCPHSTVMKDLCAECGADLRQLDSDKLAEVTASASVSMVHSIPELRVSHEQAQQLGRADKERLLKNRKLVLLVDLDQTLIHTTYDNVSPDLEDVVHFQLYGPHSPWYHTRFRPGTKKFLEKISTMYELHICTFGARPYAHKIASILDPQGKLFSHRILSRDECFNPVSKTGNLKALFPCGDSMVCIIDDREDVWNYASNLIPVKPYSFFHNTGDINAPPGLAVCTDKGNKFVSFPTDKMPNDSDKDDAPMVKSSNCQQENTSKSGDSCLASHDQHCVVSKDDESESDTFKVKKVSDPSETKMIDESADADKNMQQICEDTGTNVESASSSTKDTCSSEIVERSDSQPVPTTESFVMDKVSNDHVKKQTTSKASEAVPTSVMETKCDTSGTSDVASQLDVDKTDKPDDNATKPNDPLTTRNQVSFHNVKNTETEHDAKSTDTDNENKCKSQETTRLTEDDDYLLYLEEILTIVHKAYFDMYDQMLDQGSHEIPDLKDVIPYVRRKVLKGVSIVFSGVIPTNMPPEKNKFWNMAKSLGATITPDIILPQEKGPTTTHVIAAKLGTAKVNRARRIKGISIVNPNWLLSCAERWEHVNEQLFPLSKEGSIKPTNSQCRSVASNVNSGQVPNRSMAPMTKVNSDNACPVYDPVTGKRIRIGDKAKVVKPEQLRGVPSGTTNTSASCESANKEDSCKLQDSYNPLLAFSQEDLAEMGKEVEDACSGDDSDDGNGEESDEPDSDREVSEMDSQSCYMTGNKAKRSKGSDTESSSVESLTGGECPSGWKRRKKSQKGESLFDYEKDDFGGVLESEEEENPCPIFPRRELPYDSDRSEDNRSSSDDFNESIGSVDEEMAAAVEREFLGS